MTRIGIRELRDNLTATIRRVRGGESFEVTHHGDVVAVLAPPRRSRLEELVAAGEATPPKRPLDLGRRPVRIAHAKTASEILQELRADRI
jgi:antitoxin (DNA-binding transcriptional repressor) of toxin-antitoxin stability system